MAGKRKVLKKGSLWPVNFMESKAQRLEAIKHAKKLVVLHAMRMAAPLDGLSADSAIKLKMTYDELAELTGIGRRNDLKDVLDWLEKHGGLRSEQDKDGWGIRRSGVYVLGKVTQSARPATRDGWQGRLIKGHSKTQWFALRLGEKT